jgi:hypothetical protein
VRALACRPTGFFGFLLCGLIWFLLVIEIVIFVAFVLLFGLYALLNIMSILSYLGAVVTKGGS